LPSALTISTFTEFLGNPDGDNFLYICHGFSPPVTAFIKMPEKVKMNLPALNAKLDPQILKRFLTTRIRQTYGKRCQALFLELLRAGRQEETAPGTNFCTFFAILLFFFVLCAKFTNER
jgi:hypothetical protein